MLEIKKKNTQFSILEIDKFNIGKIKQCVCLFDKEWDFDQSRQQQYKTHKNTKFYPLRKSDYYWKNGEQLTWEDINYLTDDAQYELEKIYNRLEFLYQGKVIRSELVNMLANTKINKHVDAGDSLYIGRRIHIPIITNENVFFYVLNNKINMFEGIGYEINNGMPHSVENNSMHNRIHLIIDVMPDLTN